MTHQFAGWLEISTYGEGDNVLYLVDRTPKKIYRDEPLADQLGFMDGHFCTVRYWVTDKEASRDEAVTEFLNTLSGDANVQFGSHYSELTGYLWTDEECKVGGHDLIDRLKTDVGKYLILEIDVAGET